MDSETHPYHGKEQLDVVRQRIYEDSVREHLTYFDTTPKLYRSTELNSLADHGRYQKIYEYIREGNGPIVDFKPEMLVEEIKKLNADLGIPKNLSEVGVKEEVIPAMAEDAMKSGNIPANPRQTNVKDIIALYHKAMNMD